MALDVIFAIFVLILGGLLFPYIEYVAIILSPHYWYNPKQTDKQKDNPYSQVGDLKNSRRYTEENSFADAILWADVGNDL